MSAGREDVRPDRVLGPALRAFFLGALVLGLQPATPASWAQEARAPAGAVASPGLRSEAVTPEQFGAVGDGRDDTAALQAALAHRAVRLSAGSIYGFRNLVAPPGTTVESHGATLRPLGAGAGPFLTLETGASWDRLIYAAGVQPDGDAPSIVLHHDVRIGVLELTAEAPLGRTAVRVLGDRVTIGEMRSRDFARPLHVEGRGRRIEGFRLGWHDFQGIARGIRIHAASNVEVGGGRQSGRFADAAEERPGRNNLLLSGLVNARFGPMDLADAPEHAIRFGGGGGPSRNVTFGPLTVRRNAASAIKINPGVRGRVRDVMFEHVRVIDPFTETGRSARASHLIRISHADRIRILGGDVELAAAELPSGAPGVLFAIADSTALDFGPFRVSCCIRTLAAFIEDNDWDGSAPYGGVGDVVFRGISAAGAGSPTGVPIRLRTATVAVDDVRFEGLDLPDFDQGPLFAFDGWAGGDISVEGRTGAADPSMLEGVPADAAISIEIAAPDRPTHLLRRPPSASNAQPSIDQ